MSQQSIKNGSVFAGKWIITSILGEGSFGSVYLVKRSGTKSEQGFAALKVEMRNQRECAEILKMEVYVLKEVHALNHTGFFCTIHDFGQTNDYNFIVITLLWKPLADIRREHPRKKFDIISTLKIGIQLMNAFYILHKAGFVHRDVKPLNMAPGYRFRAMIYVYDFGLARPIYEDKEKTILRPARNKVHFRGTFRYCSINAQKNLDQGRVDDLWGVLYCLIEFCTGMLPWAGVPPSESCSVKEQIKDHELLKKCPTSFWKIKQRLNRIRFEDTPDYMKYVKWMRSDLLQLGARFDDPGCWEKRSPNDAKVLMKQTLTGKSTNEHIEDDENEDMETMTLPDSTYSTLYSETTGGSRNIDTGAEDTLDHIPMDLMNRRNAEDELKEERKRHSRKAKVK